jgi:hypothetical protein
MNGNIAVWSMISGALSMGYAVAALFFLRFWRDTHDRLFVFFALAFGVLSLQRIALAMAMASGEDTLLFYVLRLAAFLLILIGIIDKNRAR